MEWVRNNENIEAGCSLLLLGSISGGCGDADVGLETLHGPNSCMSPNRIKRAHTIDAVPRMDLPLL